MANIELLPCPFCTSTNDEHVALIITQSAGTNTGDFAVKCLGCGAWGPYGASNRTLAVEFWNRREGMVPVTVTDVEGVSTTASTRYCLVEADNE